MNATVEVLVDLAEQTALEVVPVAGWTGRQTVVDGDRVFVAPQASAQLERDLALQAVAVLRVLEASPVELSSYETRIAVAQRFHAALERLTGSAGAQAQLDRSGDAVAMVAGLERMRDDLGELEEAHREGLALGADRLQHYGDFLERVTARLARG